MYKKGDFESVKRDIKQCYILLKPEETSKHHADEVWIDFKTTLSHSVNKHISQKHVSYRNDLP